LPTATINSIRKSELELIVIIFVNSDKVVIIAELFDGWEVSVLLALEW
jgi:hypothetical protein